DLEIELLHGLRGHQADHPVRPGDDLDDGRHAVTLDPRDDPGEPVAGRLGHDRSIRRGPATLVEQSGHVADVDESLAAPGPGHPQTAVGSPAPEGFDRDPEHLGGLAHPEAPGLRFALVGHSDEVSTPGRLVSRSSAAGAEDSEDRWDTIAGRRRTRRVTAVMDLHGSAVQTQAAA